MGWGRGDAAAAASEGRGRACAPLHLKDAGRGVARETTFTTWLQGWEEASPASAQGLRAAEQPLTAPRQRTKARAGHRTVAHSETLVRTLALARRRCLLANQQYPPLVTNMRARFLRRRRKRVW
eukprot:scaffold4147_cov412-Prasinococcus_capsulatus_cf.AAC.2